MGMFYRTLRIIDNGIKPCYVFDGAPPTLKNGEVPIHILCVLIVAGETICETGGSENGFGGGKGDWHGRGSR